MPLTLLTFFVVAYIVTLSFLHQPHLIYRHNSPTAHFRMRWCALVSVAVGAIGAPIILRSSDDPLRPGKVILQRMDNDYIRDLEKRITPDNVGDLEDVIEAVGLSVAEKAKAKAVLVTPLQFDTVTINPISLTSKALKDLNKKGRAALDVTTGENVLIPGMIGFLSPGANGVRMEQLPINSEYDLWGIFHSSYEDTDPFIGEPLVKQLMKLIPGNRS